VHLEPYHADELNFAYCCHVYYRWHTYRRHPHYGLGQITAEQLEVRYPDVHILDLEAGDQELVLMASVRPTDSVSTAASKLKGATSKTIRTIEEITRPEKVVGGGYFACTVGPSTSAELDRYLERQSRHHGYEDRVNPPVWGRTWAESGHEADSLEASHSRTIVRWHVVFSTWNRKGTFTAPAAEAVTHCWADLAEALRLRFIKVSFLADHAHLAIRSHPAVVPADVVLQLLNSSQDLMVQNFPGDLLRTRNPRVWKPGAYIGTVGDLTNRHIRSYIRSWQRSGGAPDS